MLDRLDTNECKEFRLFVHSVHQTTLRNKKTQVWNWRQSSHIEVKLTLQERFYATVYTGGFRKCCNFIHKTSSIHIKGWTRRRLSAVNFLTKSRSKSFNNGIVYNRVGFKCICATISRHYTELFYKLCTRATESGSSMACCNFRKVLPINVTKVKIMFFDEKLSKPSEFYYLETGLYPSITDIVEAINTLLQERHNHSENFITIKVSRRTQKSKNLPCKWKIWSFFL